MSECCGGANAEAVSAGVPCEALAWFDDMVSHCLDYAGQHDHGLHAVASGVWSTVKRIQARARTVRPEPRTRRSDGGRDCDHDVGVQMRPRHGFHDLQHLLFDLAIILSGHTLQVFCLRP